MRSAVPLGVVSPTPGASPNSRRSGLHPVLVGFSLIDCLFVFRGTRGLAQLAEDELQNCILLVFANKQDLPNAMSPSEITDKLGLNELRGKTWYIQAACAPQGEGLYDGLDWLSQQMATK